MSSAVRCPSCGHALFTIDSPLSPDQKPRAELGTASASGAPLLLRISEAADLLRMSRSAVYQLIATGQLPVVGIGRSVRISRQELARLAGASA
jgi:excisionase family DNA binding protein